MGMEGYQVATIESVVGEIDIFVTATGNKDIVMLEHMRKMKNNAIVGNIGHFDTEIEFNALANADGIKVENIKEQTDRFVFPDGHGIICLLLGACSIWDAPPVIHLLSCPAPSPTKCSPSLTFSTIRRRRRTRTTFICCRSIWTRRSLACTSPLSSLSSQS